MQGQLSEIDIRSILQLIELGQRTGELYVEAYTLPSEGFDRLDRYRRPVRQAWFVFFLNGQIIYAGNADNRLNRLQDYLKRYQDDHYVLEQLDGDAIASVNAPEYGYLWALLERHRLTPDQGRSILQSMIHETLFDLLGLHQGAFAFELGAPLSPQLTTFPITQLVVAIMKQIQEWKKFSPLILHPEQCPLIPVPNQLKQPLGVDQPPLQLTRWMDGKTSIRQLARYLGRDLLTVAKVIYPFVRRGMIQLVQPQPDITSPPPEGLEPWTQNTVPRIVCIDDGRTVRETVEQILDKQGYEVSSIANPLKALSLLFQLKPDLILCDIAMPELDGYELCAMLRQSRAFRQIPIVMLTGKDGFIDRVRAHIVGADDYLTKPFGAQELLTLVEKYVGRGNPERTHPETLLAEVLEDELEIRTMGSSIPSPMPDL